jgi:hypothetical protein
MRKFFRDVSLLMFILSAVGWGGTAIMKNNSGFGAFVLLLIVFGTVYVITSE